MPRHQLRIDAGIAHLQLEGALDAGLVGGMAAACAELSGRRDVTVVLVSAEPATWEGWDPAVWTEADSLGLVGDPFAPLAGLPQPVVTALDGRVMDAGLELALAADLRVAARAAALGLPGIGQGQFPIAGGLQRLARTIGRSRATQMALTGVMIDAATALDWGLVGEVADDAQEAARAQAQRIAERGPIAVRLAKEAVHRGLEMPLDQALRYETDLTVLLQTTADRAEGVRAFLEKRAPHFRGE